MHFRIMFFNKYGLPTVNKLKKVIHMKGSGERMHSTEEFHQNEYPYTEHCLHDIMTVCCWVSPKLQNQASKIQKENNL